MFNVGDEIVCVDNDGVSDCLMVGKKYVVIGVDKIFVKVCLV